MDRIIPIYKSYIYIQALGFTLHFSSSQMKYLGRRFTSVYILAIYSPTIPETKICMPPSVHRFFTTHSEHWIELTYLTNVNFRNLADSRADPIISRALCIESNSTVMEIEQ